MIDGNISMEEDTELRDLVVQTLENNGILAKVRAELRAGVFLTLEEQESALNPEPYLNKPVKQYLANAEGKLLFSLVREFLEYFGLDYTLSVFNPESYCGREYNYEGREKLSERLGVDSKEPLLGAILKGRIDGALQSGLSEDNSSSAKVEKINETTEHVANTTFDIIAPTALTKEAPSTPSVASNKPDENAPRLEPQPSTVNCAITEETEDVSTSSDEKKIETVNHTASESDSDNRNLVGSNPAPQVQDLLDSNPPPHVRDMLDSNPVPQVRDILDSNPPTQVRDTLGSNPLSQVRDLLGSNPPMQARDTLSSNPLSQARDLLGSNPPMQARDTLGLNPLSQARDLLGSNPPPQVPAPSNKAEGARQRESDDDEATATRVQQALNNARNKLAQRRNGGGGENAALYFDEIISDGTRERVDKERSGELWLPRLAVGDDLPPLNGRRANMEDIKELIDIAQGVSTYEDTTATSKLDNINNQNFAETAIMSKSFLKKPILNLNPSLNSLNENKLKEP